jgi:hypothetical protein
VILERTLTFRRDYKSLRFFVRPRVDRAIVLLSGGGLDPDLDLFPVDFLRGIWSARVDSNHRLTLEWIEGGIRLRRVGSHARTSQDP